MSDLLLRNIIANKIVEQAERTLGICEEGGENQGTEIAEFQKTVDGAARGEPWCMSWVQTIAKRASIYFNAANPLFPSELCLRVWNEAPNQYRTKIPGWGFVVVWQRHCGIVTLSHLSRSQFNTIEGNTNVAGSREGDAVLRKCRSLQGGKDGFRLLGFIDLPQMIQDSIPVPPVGKSA